MLINILKNILISDGIIIKGVYERSDAKVRTNEGMSPFKGFIGDEFDTNVEIVENGVHYIVDVKDGQKTGFFLLTRNTIALQSSACVKMQPYLIVLHTQAPLL